MNTVLFLGAGASRAAPLCLPTTHEFFGKPFIWSQNERNCVPNADSTNRFEKLTSPSVGLLIEIARFFKTKPEFLDIEKVMTITNYANLLESTEEGIFIIRDLKNKRQKLKQLDKEVKHLIFGVYAGVTRDQSMALYNLLFSNLEPFAGNLDIFTTNYDRAIERMFPRGGESTVRNKPVKLWDGFLPSSVGTALEWSEAGYYSNSPEDSSKYWNLNLYKLHGSVGWVKTKGSVESIDYEKVVSDLQDRVVIYPGFKGVPVEPYFSFPHQKLKEVLMKADICFVVGFSFRDEYITGIFEEVIEKRTKAEDSQYKRLKDIFLYWCDSAEEYPPETGIKKLAGRFGGNGPWIEHIKGSVGDSDSNKNILFKIGRIVQHRKTVLEQREYIQSKQK